MSRPVLVIMAAGMGSRYGGLKQIDPIDEDGHIIMDFSIFDARMAGFEKVVFIIKKELEKDFRACIGDRLEAYIEVSYVYQDLTNIPEGLEIPTERKKPWGTGHAVLSCIDVIDGPFAVINADDFYGAEAFRIIYDFLLSHEDTQKYQYAMVGYLLENTLSANGHVARGVCQTTDDGRLVRIEERTRIERRDGAIAWSEDDGTTWHILPAGCIVSLNMWGFTRSFLDELRSRFPAALQQGLSENPLTYEYFLPFVVDDLIKEQKADVTVLKTEDKWYGVTYKEDRQEIVTAVRDMKNRGLYPQHLWEVK